MDHNLSIQISEALDGFVQEQVGRGRYDSPDAVVSDALKLLRERECKLDALRAAIKEGEESGEPSSLDIEAIIRSEREAAGLPLSDA